MLVVPWNNFGHTLLYVEMDVFLMQKIYKLYSLDNNFIEESESLPNNFTGIICYSNGTKRWLKNGLLHRIDGPAIDLLDGYKEWYVDGKQHRIDGPACEYSDGSKYWWVNDKQVTELQCKLLCDMMKLKGLLK